MVVSQKYSAFDLGKGELDRRIFVDKEVYQQELEQIFGRAWLNISHESLVPNPNDFFLSYMGEDPVIVTRDSKRQLHVFLNMCRHRGNRVVRADDGNAKNFMCTYHGWTFSNEGKLVSVPGLQEAYYGELDVEHLGLVGARVDTYAGLIFATWDQAAPTLEAYLGDARWYLDAEYNRRDCGLQAIGPQKWMEPLNWKTPVDNTSDMYHTAVSHMSVALLQGRFGGRIRVGGIGTGLQRLFQSPQRLASVNGHSFFAGIVDDYYAMLTDRGPYPGSPSPRPTEATLHVFRDFYKATFPEVERRLGSFRARRLQASQRTLFPNTVIGLRLALPRGPQKTEFWSFVMYEKDAPPEVAMGARIMGHVQHIGIAGLNEQDDMDNWNQVTSSGLLTAGNRPHLLGLGLGHDGSHQEMPGRVSQNFVSENNQRGFYARWQEFMNADGWADIHIDPITAKFEGTATMKS